MDPTLYPWYPNLKKIAKITNCTRESRNFANGLYCFISRYAPSPQVGQILRQSLERFYGPHPISMVPIFENIAKITNCTRESRNFANDLLCFISNYAPSPQVGQILRHDLERFYGPHPICTLPIFEKRLQKSQIVQGSHETLQMTSSASQLTVCQVPRWVISSDRVQNDFMNPTLYMRYPYLKKLQKSRIVQGSHETL